MERTHARQLAASLLAAVAIAAIVIAIVTATLGPNAGDDDRDGHGGDRVEQSSGHGSGHE